MRTLIVTAFVSLDGVMEARAEPGHRSTGWTFKGIKHVDEPDEIKGREQEEAGDDDGRSAMRRSPRSGRIFTTFCEERAAEVRRLDHPPGPTW